MHERSDQVTARGPLRRLGAGLLGLSAAAGVAASCAESASLERSERFRRELEARGQSGSEYDGQEPSGGNVVVCPCGGNPEIDGVVLRVTLLERSAATNVTTRFPHCEPEYPFPDPVELEAHVCERLKLRVEEVLLGNSPLRPGDEIGADSDGYLPCSRGLAGVATGAQALAFARWEPPPLPACEARQACLDQCALDAELQLYGGNFTPGDPRPCHPDAGPVPPACRLPEYWCRGDCTQDFDGACAPRPEPTATDLRERWSVSLTPWGESIAFARIGEAQLSVPASELSLLWKPGPQCVQRFGNWSDLPGAFPNGSEGI